MYEAHWQLRTRPFEPRATSAFYYPSETHQAALLKLRFALENRRSLAILGGYSGTGKSLVIEQLRQQLPDFIAPVIQVSFPAMPAAELVRYLARQFGGEQELSAEQSLSTAVAALERSLTENARQGKQALIVVDEAEWLEDQGSLDVLRLLFNLGQHAASGESAVSIILSGQPLLVAQLERYPALDQRVAVRCLLPAFSVEETTAYISHRLRQAAGSVEAIFDAEALEAIHQFTDGVPRRINAICDLALIVGYAQEQSLVNAALVESVHRELMPAAAD
jgi:general secretion pathway protein A